ncbi:hypothetical protein [Pontibacillus marinus]|uniref:Uncharacterized protein n=1 Tax=Pontibacillus marinus BH030004 = DSM 16465 TaxID=1385511 RepID=A0A0A5GHR7_9BACI|nr:hypothetical protein [Pontibacillus marinus]KGX91519.1 hypothetical protein N783_07615 [Pontibacillus marinus BH030004 = DSM 16465]
MNVFKKTIQKISDKVANFQTPAISVLELSEVVRHHQDATLNQEHLLNIELNHIHLDTQTFSFYSLYNRDKLIECKVLKKDGRSRYIHTHFRSYMDDVSYDDQLKDKDLFQDLHFDLIERNS